MRSINRLQTRSLSLVALFAAFIAVLGLIPKIDLPFGLPITAQSMGAMLAGCLLGGRRGLQAIGLFLLAVAAGLPLLSGGRGGLGAFATPAVGYLAGFLAGAWVTGLLMERLPHETPWKAATSAWLASFLGGVVILHALGVLGMAWMTQMPLVEALWLDLIFVPGDLVKCTLCAAMVHTVSKALPDWFDGMR